MKAEFAGPIIEQHDAKFLKGFLGFCLEYLMRWLQPSGL